MTLIAKQGAFQRTLAIKKERSSVFSSVEDSWRRQISTGIPNRQL